MASTTHKHPHHGRKKTAAKRPNANKKGAVRALRTQSARRTIAKQRADPGVVALKMIWSIRPEHFQGTTE